MNQPAQRPDMRLSMPNTARFVEARRVEFGAAHVNDCIRRAIAGEAGLFYAIESGHVLGTPFPVTSSMADWQRWAIVAGMKFAAFIQAPPGQDGTFASVSAGDSEGTNGAH
jgi:hypothetical protein